MTGIVTDQSGATVPGATVTATNQATNVAYTAVANEAGNYTVTSLPLGIYVVKSELSGFKTAATKPIQVEAMQIVRIDFKLELGSLEETVEVTAETPLLQTETATVGEVISGTTLSSAAAQRPQHRTALAAAAGRRHPEPEFVRGNPQRPPAAAGPTSTATGNRPTTTRSTAST